VSGTVRPAPRWASLLLVGPTGSGKTPLGEELERRGFLGRRCLHFDFGANLRAAVEGRADDYGLTEPELKTIRTSLATGALFEADDMPMIVKILTRFASLRRLDPASLLVLNGLPRHRDQAENLASAVAVERVISLEADAAVIAERMRGDPGRDRAARTDDDLAAVARRLDIFRERTAPLLGFYRERGVPVTSVRVSASMRASEIYDATARAVRDEEGL
jgi:adenylate kinase family enzyme